MKTTSLTARCISAVTALAMTFGPMMPTASAALTTLSDVPIAAKVAAKPNIVYTMDDSGSMLLPFIPDFVWGAFCRNGTGATNCAGAGTTALTPTMIPLKASEFNHMAYNPDVTYTPPLNSDGTIIAGFKDQNAANTTNWTKVQNDPYLNAASVTNLTANMSVPLYCNSDWPLDTSIGANGEFDDTKGADCRINGTRYTSKGNGAPDTREDYNYPWQNTVAPNDAQYYYTQINRKRLWCDKTSPGWPSTSTGCTQTCTVGTVVNTSTAQTCNFVSNQTTCTSTIWSPAGCNTQTVPFAYCSPGVGVPPECAPGCGSSCGSTAITGKNAKCSISGASCNCAGAGCTLPSCPNVNVATGCTMGGTLTTTCSTTPAASANCSTPLANDPSKTMLDDANGAGTTCRHNNQFYATGGTAGLFKYNSTAQYPGEGLGSGKFNTLVADASCPTIPTSVSIPQHYYTVDSVQFCSSKIVTNNDQWKGFGTGSCQTKNDLSTFVNAKFGQFHRVDLVNDGRNFAYTDIITGTPGTRTYAQEMTNYANWWAYYRTRLLAAKTVSATSFSYLDSTYRVGFHTLNTADTKWLDVADFDATHHGDWNTMLFGLNPPVSNQTPTLDALMRIGNLFKTGTSGGVTADSPGLPAGVVDPITLSCQSNYHILFTDGTTNQPNIPTVAGVVDNDENEPASFPPEIPPDNVLPNLNPNVGKPWQRPFRQGATPVSSSLSDIATYYWATDLRPLKNDVPAFPGKISATSTPPVKEGDGDWELDVAWWQHLNFSAISFGAEGTLDASNQTAVMQDIFSGAQNWPSFQNPNNPKTVGGAPVSRPAFAVDDLWHATVNSRGKFVYAKAPIEVAQGLANILAGIANSRKARVGTTFGGGQVLDSTNNIVFEATVEPGWGGNLAKVQIDPATANESATLWNTRDTLAAQLKPTPADAEPWFDNRRIVTLDTAGTPVPFRHPSDPGPTSGNLDATQLATLSASTLQQRKIVAYLRGGSTFAGQPIEGTSIGQFRKRFSAMGDISNSQPVVVGAPVKDIISNDAVFSDINDPGYKAFWDAHQSRSERIYVGANDGMLHAFDSSNGNEVFAYVPRAVIRSTLDATGKPDGIQALTYQDGGVPIFKHHMYVDGPVTTADVDFGGSDWHTILVGGLGKGGNAYYALDVTDPAAADEGAAAAKILWEFHDSDMNYSYGRPIIAKTYAFGWTVILTASYNNPSGFGKVYFLNPRTGAVLATLSTSAGSGTTPSGLTQLSGFTKDYHNQFVEQLYGGDLLGNVWRFDVHDPDPANWTTVKLAQLTDGAGNPQPVTTAPQIEIDFANGADRWVFVGTGQLLDTSDFNNPSPQQQQTMYAIRDGTLAAIETTGLPRTRATLPAVTSDAGLASSSATGWKFDLPIGERIVVNPEADLNVLVFAGTQAPTDPCVTSLPANIYAREFSTGASLIADAGGNRLTSFFSNDGAVGTTIVSVQDSSAGALPVLKVVFTRETNASIVPVSIIPPNLGSGHRFSIRMLGGR